MLCKLFLVCFFSNHVSSLDPKLFVCVFPWLSCCQDTNRFKRASYWIALRHSCSPSAFCYSHIELDSQHLGSDLHCSAGTDSCHQEVRQSRSQARAAIPGWRGFPRGVYQCSGTCKPPLFLRREHCLWGLRQCESSARHWWRGSCAHPSS